MIDDEDSKVRRNLVVFGSLIWLFAWLDLPSGLIMERLLGDSKEAAVPPWKLWSANLVVLLYLAMRYYSSEEHAKQLKAIDEDRRKRSNHLCKMLVQRHVDRVIATGDEAQSSMFGGTLLGQLRLLNVPDERRRVATASVVGFGGHKSPGWRSVTVNVGLVKASGTEQFHIGFFFGRRRELGIRAAAAWGSWWNTRGGTAVFAAWTLAFGAVLVVAWKLGNAILVAVQ